MPHDPIDPGRVADLLNAAIRYPYDPRGQGLYDGTPRLKFPLLSRGSSPGSAEWVIDALDAEPSLPACLIPQETYAILHTGSLATDGSGRVVSGGVYYRIVAARGPVGPIVQAIPAPS